MAEINATVHYGGNGFFVGIGPGGQALVMETNSERSSAPTPIELLLLAIGGCMGSDVVDILAKKREHVTDYRIEVQGERRQEAPRFYETIRVHHVLKGPNLSEDAVRQAVELSNAKYCSVAASLRPTAEVSVTIQVVRG
ncbi:MAG TPA: OsmC family protein [Candidatus Acidoferrales bacterium]|nr:OsmC family protein [Candidatus Acidoferrales bacterium]